MPRTLPWKNEGTRKTIAIPSPRPKARRDPSPSDLVNSDLEDLIPAAPPKKKRIDEGRTPSTSPPPAAPVVEYMRDGFDKDDGFMMVEDEFCSMAKLFTQHLHFAEYTRLKRLAKSRGNGALADIRRATDGTTKRSNTSLMREEAEENARKRKDVPDSESEENDEYLMDPQLAGLMTGSQVACMNSREDLTSIATTKSNTRAAAGYLHSPQKVERMKDMSSSAVKGRPVAYEPSSDDNSEETDDDDLNIAPRFETPPKKLESRASTSKLTFSSTMKERTKTTGEANSMRGRMRLGNEPDIRPSVETDTPCQIDQTFDRKSSRASPSADRAPGAAHEVRRSKEWKAIDFVSQRKADREKRGREQKRKARLVDDIPTFLF